LNGKKTLIDQLKKQWFFIGIAAMVVIAFGLPGVGLFMRTYKVLNIGIFLAFFITGLTLETSSLVDQLKNSRVLAAAVVSSLFVFPAIAYFLAQLAFRSWPDFSIGALIIGVAPVTVASGTVMTAIALGNIPLSLFICVLCNFLSILTIPIVLNLFLQFGDTVIDLPVIQMLSGLTIKVLAPTLIGQLLRPKLKKAIAPYGTAFSIFNQAIVLMIILNAVSSSTGHILKVGPALALVFLFMIGLHILILGMNYGLTRFMKLDRPSTAAFTIHTSQKTLTISYLVWAGYFAATYPMALIPAICYHLTQMIMDTFVAHRFRRQNL
jgi:solute carrier family 10 (sodium/bile acid cotransporter), member 7